MRSLAEHAKLEVMMVRANRTDDSYNMEAGVHL